MNILIYISDYIVPFIILSIVVYGIINGVNVYESFIKGAKSGFLTVIRLMPTLIGLMAAVGILRASGFLDFIADVIGQFSGLIGVSRRARTSHRGKNVFFLRCNRSSAGYF